MTKAFVYQDPLPLGDDRTEYRLLTTDPVSAGSFQGKPITEVAADGLTLIAEEVIGIFISTDINRACSSV